MRTGPTGSYARTPSAMKNAGSRSTTMAIRRWNTGQLCQLGVDGVFSDFAETALAARSAWLEELGL